MDLILSVILSYLLFYKYLAFFVLIFVGSFLLPLPTNLILLATGAFASQGYFNLWLAIGLALVTNIGADILGYSLTKSYGMKVLEVLHVNKKYIEKVREEVYDYASVTIFVTRIAGPFGAAVNFMSGLIGVPFRKFIIFDILGNLVDIIFYMLAGYFLGNYWLIYSDQIIIIVALVGSVILLGFVGLRWWKKVKAKI